MVDDEKEDTLTFNMKNTFIFRPDLSETGLTGNEVITTVHPLIMVCFVSGFYVKSFLIKFNSPFQKGIALTVNYNRKPMLTLASNAINGIFHNPKDPFWTGRVMDYLFDGIEIDCESNIDQFEVRAVCSIFESGDVTTIKPLRENFYKFSVLGAVSLNIILDVKCGHVIKCT